MADLVAESEARQPIAVQVDQRTIDYRFPLDAFAALREYFGPDKVFLLESLSGPQSDAKTAVVGFGPILSVEIYENFARIGGEPGVVSHIKSASKRSGYIFSNDEVPLRRAGDVWRLLRLIQSEFLVTGAVLPDGFRFGYFGYFGYDTIRFIERVPRLIPATTNRPEILLSIFRGLITFDLVDQTAQFITARSTLWSPTEVGAVEPVLDQTKKHHPPDRVPAVPRPHEVHDSSNPEEFCAGVVRALHHIGVGDIYQVQLGHEMTIQSAADPLDVYRRLRARNPAPFVYFAPFGETTLVGASPEVFVRVEQGHVTMRPLAGTIKRGKSDAEDRAAAERLRTDPKEVAEHVMLVDLCRNDVGRICKPRTLRVTELLTTGRYSHVLHLVSNVVGQLTDRDDVYDVIRSTFPGC